MVETLTHIVFVLYFTFIYLTFWREEDGKVEEIGSKF